MLTFSIKHYRVFDPSKKAAVLFSAYINRINGIILKESIRFRAKRNGQSCIMLNCPECDSFQLYQDADGLAVSHMGIVSFPGGQKSGLE